MGEGGCRTPRLFFFLYISLFLVVPVSFLVVRLAVGQSFCLAPHVPCFVDLLGVDRHTWRSNVDASQLGPFFQPLLS